MSLALVGCANPKNTGGNLQSDAVSGIIGGTDATGNEDFSHSTVAVYDVGRGALCTGSLIQANIVVTAAHCVSGAVSDLRIVFGTDLHSSNIIVRAVEKAVTSPDWAAHQNDDTNTGDIALIKMTGTLPPGFKPVSILSDVSALVNGGTILLEGYGLSDGVAQTGAGTLRYVETQIKDAAFSRSEVLMDQTHGKGACHGDSGGPAFVKVNGQYMLFGVTSRGVDDAANDCTRYSAYTNIPSWKTWVDKESAALQSGQPAVAVTSTKKHAAGF